MFKPFVSVSRWRKAFKPAVSVMKGPLVCSVCSSRWLCFLSSAGGSMFPSDQKVIMGFFLFCSCWFWFFFSCGWWCFVLRGGKNTFSFVNFVICLPMPQLLSHPWVGSLTCCSWNRSFSQPCYPVMKKTDPSWAVLLYNSFQSTRSMSLRESLAGLSVYGMSYDTFLR